MSNENRGLKYSECGICGHVRKCFTQMEFGHEQTVCQDCLRKCPDYLRVVSSDKTPPIS